MATIKQSPPTCIFTRQYLPDTDQVEVSGKVTLSLSILIAKPSLDLINIDEKEIRKEIVLRLRDYFIQTAEQLKKERDSDNTSPRPTLLQTSPRGDSFT